MITITKTKQLVINGVKILKKGVKSPDGKYCPAWYSVGEYYTYGQALCITSRSILNDLPKELGPVKNDTDTQTDYFEKDRIYFPATSPEYAAIVAFLGIGGAHV